jgi:RNA polymerase sigma factor for flagellar operon FliA
MASVDAARKITPGGTQQTVDTDALVTKHLHLVQHVVNQVASGFPRHVDRSELWSAGAYGLVDAARRYDPTSGVPFGRYAAIRVRGAIIDSTRSRDFATRRLRRDLRTMGEASERFEIEHGRTPNDMELAGMLGMAADEVASRRAAAKTSTVLQLDMPLPGSDGQETLADRIAETSVGHLPDEHLEQAELVGTIREAVVHLDGVHREVIERHFFGGELLRDIADSLGCTEARVSQLRSEALNAMRAHFGQVYDNVPEVPEEAPGRRRRAAYVASLAASSTWRSRLDAAPVVAESAIA